MLPTQRRTGTWATGGEIGQGSNRASVLCGVRELLSWRTMADAATRSGLAVRTIYRLIAAARRVGILVSWRCIPGSRVREYLFSAPPEVKRPRKAPNRGSYHTRNVRARERARRQARRRARA